MKKGKIETLNQRYARRRKRYLKDREEHKPSAYHEDANGNKIKVKYIKIDDLPEDKKEKRREMRHRAYLKGRELGKSWAINPYQAKKKREISDEERERRRLASAKWRKEHPGRSKEYMIQWRKEHGEEEQKSWQEYRRNNKKRAIEYLGGRCIKCGGIFHPDVYDFHHKDGDEKDVCVAKLLGRKFEKITEELDKCVLLCANCHRIEHAEY